MIHSRRALLRSFLLAPVAVRLAPFVRPAAVASSFSITPVNLLAFQRIIEEAFSAHLASYATYAAVDWFPQPIQHRDDKET